MGTTFATTFVWYPTAKNVGHAALALGNGTYVSWWPDGDKKGLGSTGATSSSISVDRKIEGGLGKPPRNPDYASGPLTKLNEADIENWWLKISGRIKGEHHAERQATKAIAGGRYDMAAKNCADLVLQALIVGGMPKAYPITSAMRGTNIITSPLYIKDLSEAMTGNSGNKIVSVLTNTHPATATLARVIQYFF